MNYSCNVFLAFFIKKNYVSSFKFSNKVVSELIISALYGHVAYQIEELNEKKAIPQASDLSKLEIKLTH